MLNEGENVIKNNPLSFQNLLVSSAFTIIVQLLLVGPIVVQVISIISCCCFLLFVFTFYCPPQKDATLLIYLCIYCDVIYISPHIFHDFV